jgi:hypothetical protein
MCKNTYFMTKHEIARLSSHTPSQQMSILGDQISYFSSAKSESEEGQ